MWSKNLWIGEVGAGMDLDWGALTSIMGVLSRPANHALQTILYQAHCIILRLPPP